MRSSDSIVCLAALLIVAGCPGPEPEPNPPPPNKTEVACTIGLPDDSGTFAPMRHHEDAELVLGFQGFLFFEIHVRASSVATGRADVSASATVDGEDPNGTNQRDVLVEQSGDTAVSEKVLIFLDSSNIAEFEHRNCDLRLRMDGDTWTCTATAAVKFIDEDPCIHTDADPICPGDG